MKSSRLTFSMLLLGASFALTSCGDSTPTAPPTASVAPQADLLGGLTGLLKKTGLVSCTPQPTAWDVQLIGPAGGTMKIGPNTFTVPAGALSKSVVITAISTPATVNAIQFFPEGLKFNKSASLTMSYANCNLLGSLLPKRIAYTSDDLKTIISYLLSVDDLLGKKVTGKVDHFSEYAVAW